jgi:hypothetical protein
MMRLVNPAGIPALVIGMVLLIIAAKAYSGDQLLENPCFVRKMENKSC